MVVDIGGFIYLPYQLNVRRQCVCSSIYIQHPFVDGYDGTDELERLIQTFTSLEIATEEEEDMEDMDEVCLDRASVAVNCALQQSACMAGIYWRSLCILK